MCVCIEVVGFKSSTGNKHYLCCEACPVPMFGTTNFDFQSNWNLDWFHYLLMFVISPRARGTQPTQLTICSISAPVLFFYWIYDTFAYICFEQQFYCMLLRFFHTIDKISLHDAIHDFGASSGIPNAINLMLCPCNRAICGPMRVAEELAKISQVHNFSKHCGLRTSRKASQYTLNKGVDLKTG